MSHLARYPGRGLLVCCILWLLAACDSGSPGAGLPQRSIEVSAGCDPARECRLEDKGLVLEIRLGPEIHALQPFPVLVNSRGNPSVEEISVAFSMRGMDMGWNRYRLEADEEGRWRARVTLPVCTSGRSDWRADFELRTADRRLQFSVPFVLEK